MPAQAPVLPGRTSGIIAWFVHEPIAANLLMVFLVASGAIALTGVRVEIFPVFALDRISIEVPYLGAAPEEVEAGVVVRIEESVDGIEGIREIRSTAAEGIAVVIVELDSGVDSRRVLAEVKNSVDAVTTLPLEAEEPIIRELIARDRVIDVVIFGHAGLDALRTVADRVRDELAALPAITQVDLVNAPPYEISTEVSEAALRRHGLTFDAIADAVRRSSLDLPGGSVRTAGGDVLLRTIGQAYRGQEYASLVLWSRADGSRLLLGDVATVVDGFAETDQVARFNQMPAVILSVFRTGEQSALEVAETVHRFVEAMQARLPAGVSTAVWQNQAAELQARLATMLGHGVSGLVLVIFVLMLFLQLRLAFWVSIGIPICFLGTMALMPGLGISISLLSTFAFIIVIGILVDDAIIVSEAIDRCQAQHGARLGGAVEGAREVAKPVVFAVLTTAAAFMPLAFVPGLTGKFFRVLPLVIVPCLLFSLVESFCILPAHLAHARDHGGRRRRGWLQQQTARGLAWFIERCYQPALDAALRSRYVTAAAGVSMWILTVGMVLGGWTALVGLPPVEDNLLVASVTMPPGSPTEATLAAFERIENGGARLRARLREETGTDHFRHVSTAIGSRPLAARAGGPYFVPPQVGTADVGEVTIELAPAAQRTYTSEQLGSLWRETIGPVPDAAEVRFVTSVLSPGTDIDVQLTGPDPERLRAAADAIKSRLAEYAGVHGIADSFRPGKPEMRLDITAAAETLGLTLEDLGRQVRQGFYGEEVQRIQRGRDDIRVMVRYPQDERRSLGNLEQMRIRTRSGGEVPFRYVARVEAGRGLSSIERIDRKRLVSVTAAVDPQVTSSGEIVADLRSRFLPEVLAAYPEVGYRFGGSTAELETVMASLQRGFTLAVLAVFALLAVSLRSYSQPLIIMSAIPFGLVGAVWGHLLTGLDLSVVSLFGLVALTGVVVNDSLVMVDAINRRRSVRGDLHAALRDAGGQRFRPILLTTVTTVAGLLPLMLSDELGARFLVPMATSLAFGLLFATSITLVLVPTAYAILDDIERVVAGIRG